MYRGSSSIHCLVECQRRPCILCCVSIRLVDIIVYRGGSLSNNRTFLTKGLVHNCIAWQWITILQHNNFAGIVDFSLELRQTRRFSIKQEASDKGISSPLSLLRSG